MSTRTEAVAATLTLGGVALIPAAAWLGGAPFWAILLGLGIAMITTGLLRIIATD